MTPTAKCLAGAALVMGGCLTGGALAQNAPAAAKEPPPKADARTIAQSQCLSDSGAFKTVDDHPA